MDKPRQEYTIPSDTRPGDYYVGVKVVDVGGGPECDLTNNVSLRPITITP